MVAFQAWLEVNKKRLLVGTVAAILVLFVAVLVVQRRAQQEELASKALSDLRVPFSAAAPIPPGTAEALVKLATDYRGTKAASRALLLSAGVQFSTYTDPGYNEANKLFSQVLQDYPNAPWAAEANLGIAACLGALRKTNEAVLKYEEIRKRFTGSPILDDAKLALARLYEGQKPEEAVKIYDELTKAGIASMSSGMPAASAMEANARMEDLVKRNPALAKLKESLNPPPVAPPAPVTQTLNLTNRVLPAVAKLTNAAAAAAATVNKAVAAVNKAATSAPVQIKLSPQPAK